MLPSLEVFGEQAHHAGQVLVFSDRVLRVGFRGIHHEIVRASVHDGVFLTLEDL